jgi:hypothetical protein
MARALGRRGGLARARRLSMADRQQVASAGGAARRESLLAAGRIVDNFRYVASIEALAPKIRVRRLSTVRGRLPGIYPAK